MSILLTTTGTVATVAFVDLGNRTFTHPTVDFDLTASEFTEDEIRYSTSVSDAVTAGEITLTDQNSDPITDLAGDGAHNHVVAQVTDFAAGVSSNAAVAANTAASHAISHAHNGADGSGTVTHANTTGQGTDDHHAKSHLHNGADGSGTVEGSNIKSTGEAGGTKFLREDGDNTCSWQTVSGGSAFDYETSVTRYIDSGGGGGGSGTGEVGDEWLTLKEAMEYVQARSIAPGVLLTVVAADMTTTETGGIVWSYMYGRQVLFTGDTATTSAISGYNSYSGSAGAWTELNLTVGSTATITTSHFMLVSNTSGTHCWNLAGCWPVTAVDDGTTLEISNSSDSWSGASQNNPSNWTVTSADVTYAKSVYDFSAVADHAITVKHGCVLRIEKCVIKGHASYDAFHLESGAVLDTENPVGVYGALSAVGAYASRAIVPGLCAGGCAGDGLYITDGSFCDATGASVIGSGISGAYVGTGTIQLDDVCISGNVADGVELEVGSGGIGNTGSGLIICGNGGNGMAAAFSSGGYPVTVNLSYNQLYGIWGGYNSHVRAAAATLTGNGDGATHSVTHDQVSSS